MKRVTSISEVEKIGFNKLFKNTHRTLDSIEANLEADLNIFAKIGELTSEIESLEKQLNLIKSQPIDSKAIIEKPTLVTEGIKPLKSWEIAVRKKPNKETVYRSWEIKN